MSSATSPCQASLLGALACLSVALCVGQALTFPLEIWQPLRALPPSYTMAWLCMSLGMNLTDGLS